MPVADMLTEGLKLMGLGMGIVFSFLVLLVFAMQGMSWLAHRISPEEETPRPEADRAISPAGVGSDDLIAAISAAVHSYRARHR